MSAPVQAGCSEAAPEQAGEQADDWRVTGPQPLGTFVKGDVSDQLVQLTVQLAAELWVTRRRLAAIESQLVSAGVVVSPDQMEPHAEPEDHSGRDEFIRRLFGALLT